MTYFISEVVAQRLQHLREVVPGAAVGTIGFLTNPTNLLSKPDISDILAAAQRIGQQIRVLTTSTMNEIDAAFAAAAGSTLTRVPRYRPISKAELGKRGLIYGTGSRAKRPHRLTVLLAAQQSVYSPSNLQRTSAR